MAVATGGSGAAGRAGVGGVASALSRSPYTLANFITFGRLLAGIPAVVLITLGWFEAALWLCVAAGLSDVVDGYLAKRFNARTALGALLDPVADKVLLISVYVALALVGSLPAWLVGLVILRDVLIVLGSVHLWRVGRVGEIRPLLIGKANTLAQIVLVVTVLTRDAGILDLPWITDGLVVVVAVLTVGSGLTYLYTIATAAVARERHG